MVVCHSEESSTLLPNMLVPLISLMLIIHRWLGTLLKGIQKAFALLPNSLQQKYEKRKTGNLVGVIEVNRSFVISLKTLAMDLASLRAHTQTFCHRTKT